MLNANTWVEKYRPDKMTKIVIDPLNRRILNNIINTNRFPNLLFYGPPGTGKTTTIINLIDEYQKKYANTKKGLSLHLNASDERGVDVIRGQIQQFVNSNALFNAGMKFVILDEVDYMTKPAQQALKNLIQNFNSRVRFCLLCNYISKIDHSLQNIFLRIHFNELPPDDIIHFVNNICIMEQVEVSQKTLQNIQSKFGSDIRSMINYIQSNGDTLSEIFIIDDTTMEYIILLVQDVNKHISVAISYMFALINNHNIDVKYTLKMLIMYIITHKYNINLPDSFFKFSEFILHNSSTDIHNLLSYSMLKLREMLL